MLVWKGRGGGGAKVPLAHRLLEKENQNSLYFIAHKGNLEDLMNNGFRDHLKCRPKCSGNLILQKINQHVISTDLKLVCSKCDWKGVEKNVSRI